jgi:hypothetical protein
MSDKNRCIFLLRTDGAFDAIAAPGEMIACEKFAVRSGTGGTLEQGSDAFRAR